MYICISLFCSAQGVRLLGILDVGKTPCAREAILHGAGGSAVAGLVHFLATSKSYNCQHTPVHLLLLVESFPSEKHGTVNTRSHKNASSNHKKLSCSHPRTLIHNKFILNNLSTHLVCFLFAFTLLRR